MVIEALWTVEFIGDVSFRAGVVVVETNRIFGGDSQYYYLGTFEVDHAGMITADVRVTNFAGNPYSVFGPRKKFRLKLSGPRNLPEMYLKGHMVEDPQRKITMRLVCRENLP